MSLVERFLERARERPNALAIVDRQLRTVSYGDLAAISGRWAIQFAQSGIGTGDRVLVAIPVSTGLYACLAALWRIGAVAVFPEPALGLAGLGHAAEATDPKAFVAPAWIRAVARLTGAVRHVPLRLSTPSLEGSTPPKPGAVPDPGIPDDHPALVSFTSGSTGRPKGIVRTHGFLVRQGECLVDLLNPGFGRVDLVGFPAFVLVNLGYGSTSVLPNWNMRRPARASGRAVVRHLRQTGATRVLAPPVICERLTEVPSYRLAQAGLDTVFTGGGPVFPSTVERLRTAGIKGVVSVYGSTEAEPIAHLNDCDVGAGDRLVSTNGGGLLAGTPVPEVSLRIVDDEIQVSGDHVNKGYLDPRQDASTKVRDGDVTWHRTGDAGRLDEHGRLWLLGRHGARNGRYYPFQVEAAVMSWPGVRRAALTTRKSESILAIEGDPSQLPCWVAMAKHDWVGIRVVQVGHVPMDRRHGSKVDYGRLNKMTLT